jgi:opacity protein-like surface antigen
MKESFVVATVAIILFAANPALAQYRAEIGVDAGWTGLDDDISGADAWRLGFRAGYAFLNWLQIEGQVAGSHGSEGAGSVNLDTTLLTAIVNGVFNLRTRGVAPYALAGFGGANLQVSPGVSSFSDFAPAWQVGGGSRFFVTGKMALRAEVLFLREKTFQTWNGHWNVTGGVSWVFGEK